MAMQPSLSMWQIPGLDEKAQAAIMAEQQMHLSRIAEIAKSALGTWAYTLSDENDRHCRYLQRIFIESRKRAQNLDQ